MLNFRRKVRIETERMTLRLPQHNDWKAWAGLRAESATFLTPWEPLWAGDHLTRRAFTNRVYWAARAEAQGTALPLMLVRREDQMLLGAITLDNIRRGPVQAVAEDEVKAFREALTAPPVAPLRHPKEPQLPMPEAMSDFAALSETQHGRL